MKRRKFFLLTASGATVLAIPSWYYLKEKNKGKNPLLSEPQQLSYIWDEETMLKVGKLYLNQNPKENTEENLINLLSKNITSKKTDLNKVIQEDHKLGKIVMIDGWFLSTTEARQCALYRLKQNNS